MPTGPWTAILGGRADPDAVSHRSRIASDGGAVTNFRFLSNFIRDLKRGPDNCYTTLSGLWLPCAVKKDGTDKVATIYDVSTAKTGVYYDAVQSNGSLQQTWTDGILDGLPVIQFDAALGADAGYTTGAITAVAQPTTVMVIVRKDGGGVTFRHIIDSSVGRLVFAYNTDTTQLIEFAGASVLRATDQATFGQFTVKFDGVSSYIARKGAQIGAAGNAGANGQTGVIKIGLAFNDTAPMNGPMAILLQGNLSAAQISYVEGLLNTKYFPSTIA